MLKKRLFELADSEYKKFSKKLIPTVEENRIIGIRTPLLRSLAKEYAKEEHKEFLDDLPHFYYEENNLHAYLIEQLTDFDEVIQETEKFLPFIDNWSTCDTFSPKVFKKNPNKLREYINKWIKAEHTYTVRYAIKLLMNFFPDDLFEEEILEQVAEVKSDEYYINMMIAWFFATALAKQYDSTLIYITERRLDVWVHNKTIQKAVESNRIEKSVKDYLKTLKIKQ